MQFDRVMCLHGSHIGFFDFHGSVCERRLGVAASTANLQFPFRFKVIADVRFFRAIDYLDSGSSGLCLVEFHLNGEPSRMTIARNRILCQWTTSLILIKAK